MQEFGGPGDGGQTPDVVAEQGIIKDTDMTTFMEDVVEKSMSVPVLVSFHSNWSENCKQLAPILEKLVHQAGGAIHMVRVDFEKNQQLASQMRIQSVPTIVVFSEQRPVDAFAGVKSEQEVKEFISKYVPDMQPSPIEKMIGQAGALFEEGDFQSAGGLYSQAFQLEPENALALAGLCQCLIKLGDLENAGNLLSEVPKSLENHAAIMAAQAAFDMAGQLSELGDAATLQKAVEKDENDHQARFDLALILWTKEDREAAADHLLEIVRRDRGWNEDGARKQLVKFFDLVGPMDPFTVKIRKKLSSLLFC